MKVKMEMTTEVERFLGFLSEAWLLENILTWEVKFDEDCGKHGTWFVILDIAEPVQNSSRFDRERYEHIMRAIDRRKWMTVVL